MTLLLCMACGKPVPVSDPVGGTVVATVDLAPGTELTPDVLALANAAGWGAGLVRSVAEVQGRFVREPVVQGEPVRLQRLADVAHPEGTAPLRLSGTPVGPLGVGDYVDPIGIEGDAAQTVAVGLRVVAVHDDGLTIEGAEDLEDGGFTWTLRQPVDVTGIEIHGPASDALALPDGQDGTAVWVALRELQPGVRVTADDVQRVWVAGATVPVGADALKSELDSSFVPATRVLPGEVVRPDRLVDLEARIAPLVPRGMRAVTVDHDPSPSMAGGAYVDVVHVEPAGSRLFAQGVFVMSHPNARTSTLLVTEEQAEGMAVALRHPDWRMALALRNDLDLDFVED